MHSQTIVRANLALVKQLNFKIQSPCRTFSILTVRLSLPKCNTPSAHQGPGRSSGLAYLVSLPKLPPCSQDMTADPVG